MDLKRGEELDPKSYVCVDVLLDVSLSTFHQFPVNIVNV